MKKIVLSAFVIAGLMFTSCDKNDDDASQNEGNVYLPTKINSSDYTTIFNYDDNGLLTKIVESDGYEYTFSYSGDQLVEFVESETYQGNSYVTTYTFSQSGNTITIDYVYEYNGGSNSGTSTLEVDNKGYLINDDYFAYTYDANGNTVKMTSKYGDEATLTFDSKNGIFKNIKLPQWVLSYFLGYQTNHINNALSFEFVSTEDPEDNNSGTIVYEYNNDGYPTKTTAASTEDGTEVQTIEYIKK